MADLKLALVIDDDNPDANDLFLSNGTMRLTNSLSEEVAQRIYVSLRIFKGEWFLDPAQGIPYWQNILGHKAPLSQVARIFRNAVSQQPGVKKITKFNVVRVSGRGVKIVFACTLTDGTVLESKDFAPFIVGGV